MKTAEKGLDEQISLWPLVGPFLLLASLTLLFWNVPERALVFGVVAALSLALSWQWTWKGVAISMALLALGFWYHAGSMDLKETLWHLGMSLALTLGFAVTALSREETAERLLQLFPEPSINNEELEKLTKQLADQKSTVKSLEQEVQTSREAFAQQRDRVMGLEQLLEVSREEIKTAQQEHEQLQREVLQRKESAARSLEQMAEAKEEARFLAEELKALKAGEETALGELKTLLVQRDHQLKLLQADLEKIQQDIRSSKAQAEGQARRAAFLEEEKQAMMRTWERERGEAQQKADASLAQLKSQLEASQQKLASTEELSRRTVSLEEEKQAMLRTWERERGEAQQKADARLAQLKSQLEAEMQKEKQKADDRMAQLKSQLETETHRATTLDQVRQEMQQRVEAAEQNLSDAEQHLKAKMAELHVQLELMQQNMAVAEAQKIAHWRAMRTAEGKHQQLREQFEEKSSQLNEARRERFTAEEAMESLILQLEELTHYERTLPEKPMIKHLARLEREHAASLTLLEKEIDSLQGLISHLFKEKA